jgi:hypothetical protein
LEGTVKTKLLRCRFVIAVEKDGDVYLASCPGLGGVFEESADIKEAIKLAARSAIRTIEIRGENGTLPKNSRYFAIVRDPVIIPSAKPRTSITPGMHEAYYSSVVRAPAYC